MSILEEHEVFNYELVLLRYSEACEDYFRNPNMITGPWTKKVRALVINSIKEKQNTISWMGIHIDIGLENYQIVLDEGEEKLVHKGTTTEVLTYEESFDVFVELHLQTDHGGFEVILKKLENKFLIIDKCLNFFLLHCNLCKKTNLQNRKPEVFNDCITVDILKAPIPDSECRFILFYIDSATKFKLFRPLIAMDEYEISIEMFKIFTDFGPPQVIKTSHVALLNNVLTTLERGGFHYDISIQTSDKVIGESYSLMQEILSRTNEDHDFWATICRFIQFKHNNKLVNSIQTNSTYFYKKIANKKYSVRQKKMMQQNNIESVNNSVTLSKLQETINHSVFSTESSETDSVSDAGELQASTLMTSENTLNLTEDVLNENTNDSVEMRNQSLCGPTVEKDDNEVKIEFNPLTVDSHWLTSTEELCLPNIEENEDQNQSHTSLTLDSSNIPLIQDPLEESSNPIAPVSSMELLPMSPDPNAGPSTQHKFSVGILRKQSKRQDIGEILKISKKEVISHDNMEIDYDLCSSCNGKMYTDFFCFGCKKKTHIFCLTKYACPIKTFADTVNSFNYCNLCSKDKVLKNYVRVEN